MKTIYKYRGDELYVLEDDIVTPYNEEDNTDGPDYRLIVLGG